MTTFLTLWSYEEMWHGEAAAGGVGLGPDARTAA
jgi:hypothetical protein